MDARPVKSDSVQKATPSIEISPLSYEYVRSPSNVDSNLLVLLHGLGDTHLPFLKLGESLQKTLPQTAVLALRAGTPIPLLMGIGQEAWCWWESFDMLGQEVANPNPSQFLQAFAGLLEHLITPEDNGGCGWRPSSIHLLGFAQGASAALEGTIFWTKRTVHSGQVADDKQELGSVVSICGNLLSHPTSKMAVSTPLLHFHRLGASPSKSEVVTSSLSRVFANIEQASMGPVREGVTEAMPQGLSEWDPIMRFWSRLLRNRTSWELEGDLFTMSSSNVGRTEGSYPV
ncbi:hypothetical protein FA10DRAFT_269681 [Acaromyces ingoldii]|uniref:Phospholipase/carboxylesterase/thioesterase domain-containing protein n=1 Tax=Acaromyces ingoldii TaxID=215250 RepID=A0A316YB93_9BASI|nr:hypothetical protein FA10DRAFT_269681 [Acaromyces ingoldii]PWN87070.1 hypothetical protein FA10DRAFT_269681 [Acaromyces ingoldii]